MESISIIVPVYNVEKYIEKCIESILNQTYKNFELILVNDGSEDNCGYICDRYACNDSRIKVIHKQNGGLSSARNKGIDVATGDYIAFVDSDDYIHKNMYELMINSIKNDKSDIVICDFKYIFDNEQEESNGNKDINKVRVEEFTNIEGLWELYGRTPVKFEIACNKLYKKELFDNIRYEENRIYEDSIIIHRLLYLSKKSTYIDYPLYMYLQRKGSITSNSFTLKNLDGIYALKKRVDFFKIKNLVNLKYKADYDYRVRFINDYFKAKKLLPNCKKILSKLKKDFNKDIVELQKNPYFTYKEKAAIYIFMISPLLYEVYIKHKYKKPIVNKEVSVNEN